MTMRLPIEEFYATRIAADARDLKGRKMGRWTIGYVEDFAAGRGKVNLILRLDEPLAVISEEEIQQMGEQQFDRLFRDLLNIGEEDDTDMWLGYSVSPSPNNDNFRDASDDGLWIGASITTDPAFPIGSYGSGERRPPGVPQSISKLDWSAKDLKKMGNTVNQVAREVKQLVAKYLR